MHPLLRKAVPPRIREGRYKLRRLGLAKFVRYYRIERGERRKPAPSPGELFDIGGAQIRLHETTVHSVLSHWVEYAHGIQELRAFCRLAVTHELLLDIGAAEGIYSAAFCSLTGRVAWAFEPSPTMFRRLGDLRLANPEFSIEATNVALDSSSGDRPVRRSPDGQYVGLEPAAVAEMMVTTTLDAFVARHNLRPDFAKIDVEGMELDVLLGGETTFRESVRTIVLEVHYNRLAERGQSAVELQELLENYGFRLEALDASPVGDLESYARSNPEPLPGYTVVVCRKPCV